MTFTFRAEYEQGRSVELVPTAVQPLGPADIRRLEEARGEGTLQIQLSATEALIDGESTTGAITVKAHVDFAQPTTIFALVRGGWVPMPFAIPPRFLVDRNVVIALRRIRQGATVAIGESLQWWTNLFADGGAIFNPLLYAFEAGFRRKPTYSEFVEEYKRAAEDLHLALPKCEVVNLLEQNFRAAYRQLEAFDERYSREADFLKNACPLVSQRVTRSQENALAKAVIELSDQHRLQRSSLVTISVLSCVFEDIHGTPLSIGRQVLKPKATYTDEAAFNAISDLRHIEIAAANQAYLAVGNSFALCTCDRPLALLWSSLSLQGNDDRTDGSVELKFNLTNDMFSRLHYNELERLKERLKA